MSFEQWKQIRDNAVVNCDVALKSVDFVNSIPGAALSLANEYNELLLEDFINIATFIDSQGLWPQLKLNQLNTTWLRHINKQEKILATGLPGIGAKYAAIQMLVSKLNQIFYGEKGYVDKAQHAFSLLNRKLFLLENFRNVWVDAFNKNAEPTLEKLGGLHLFECGIWAFKAKGPKEETDLILDQSIDAIDERIPLVMTEWKKATSEEDAEKKISQAQIQCEIYTGGVARPLQIKDHRFIVVVSKTPLKIDRQFDSNQKRYIVRNIAIECPNPSIQAAKEMRKRSKKNGSK